MRLTFGLSPCPNDTFMLEALINNKIDRQGLDFDFILDDVEHLNKKALQGLTDISKMSISTFAAVADQYILLDAGAAIGYNNGPVLIAKEERAIDNISSCRIAIPGRHTTAHLLLSIAYPEATNTEEMLFSAIENAVLTDKTDMGLIIHERRFTYANKGLCKLADLGEYWQTKTGLPLPLGAIAVKRTINRDIQILINTLITESILEAMKNPAAAMDFVKKYADEKEETVIYKHIQLYVNNYSVSLKDKGRKAIETLCDMAEKKGFAQRTNQQLLNSSYKCNFF